METWVGIVLSTIGLLMGINQWRINDVIKTINLTTKRLDERISQETLRTDTELSNQSKHYLSELNGVAERLGSQIRSMSDSVIYKDVFEQHEKLQDTRYIFTEKTFRIMEEVSRTAQNSNTKEHDRLGQKMDDIPGLIRTEIDRAFQNGRG